MRKMLTILLAAALCAGTATAKKGAPAALRFDASAGVPGELVMPQGCTVHYTAYERLYYVTNVEDSTYQYLNIYVPEGATSRSPIFLRTYVGGYMASAAASPQAGDASGRALMEGYVVVIPGSRGRNSTVETRQKGRKGKTSLRYTGRAPKALLDLKAAVRYLREFDGPIPGNKERIVTDGTSAGGAMSSLLGATGNHPDYEPLLQQMGAARQRDDVFCSVCFCPITDLDHADMAYEWLYNGTDSRQQGDSEVLRVSDELKAQFPAYVASLGLRTADGQPLTADNYLGYIKLEIIRAAQLAKNAGADIPDTLGFTFSQSPMGMFAAPLNGGRTGQPLLVSSYEGAGKTGTPEAGQGLPPQGLAAKRKPQPGDYIVDLDMPTYLNYVVSTQALKTAPAFDTKGVCGQEASGENEEFGDATGSSASFTAYGAAKNGTAVTDEVSRNVRLLNPMAYIGTAEASVAPHWYIRHGARDRDTAFPVPINLALKLQNSGKDVNFLLAWNRPHSGDYALDELFAWLNNVVR